jgi:hypothetical protein
MANDKEGIEDQSDANSDDSADNFGLPDIEYKPIDRDKETTRQRPIESSNEPEPVSSSRPDTTPPEYSYDDDEPRSRAPLFVGLIIIVVVLVGGFLLYKYWYVPRGIKAREEIARKEAEEKRLAEEARLQRLKDETEKHRLDSIAASNAKPPVGTIETLSERTRRFYVVVTSDIDDDLLMDFAVKLSKKGVSSKIIPPVGESKFYRLAIADFDTYNAAQTSADGSKGEYGPALWVMRY